MYHVNACDGTTSVCGCCDCTYCETHSEFADLKYDEDYDEWVAEQQAKELDKPAVSEQRLKHLDNYIV